MLWIYVIIEMLYGNNIVYINTNQLFDYTGYIKSQIPWIHNMLVQTSSD